ncbi:FtsB family cell division protein [Kyrpidia tusciae]|uniref:Septum formation initiator n=1 Tax=Kyrpidia tusciae (strain DSM 2912 / NBRC 15312 / T2) TaxID=562970 RepID=D5WRK3_KYRT2|nr:septum formation initiator family protein [Kyrpidia tusciae]ADG04864.1 Septum formation initiator [Kyrpidia tusciae DSM 2912]MBE3552140.1 septum formation initiator family protein [Kyrpidia tusciae]
MTREMVQRRRENVIRLTRRRKGRRWRLPRLKLRYLFLLSVLAWAGYTAVFVQWPKMRSLEAQQEQANAKLQRAQQQNQALKEQVRLLQQDQYVADLARQQFHMAKPGEILFMTQNSATP